MDSFRFRDRGESDFFEVLKKRFLVTAFALRNDDKTYLVDIKKEMGINYLYLSKVLRILVDCGDAVLMTDSENRNEEDMWIKLTSRGTEKARDFVLLMAKNKGFRPYLYCVFLKDFQFLCPSFG